MKSMMRSNSVQKSLRSASAKPLLVTNTCLYQGLASSADVQLVQFALRHFHVYWIQIGGIRITVDNCVGFTVDKLSVCARAGSTAASSIVAAAHCKSRFFTGPPPIATVASSQLSPCAT